MEDVVIKTTNEVSNMKVALKNGQKKIVKAKTIQTYWQSGRIDCHIDILEPIMSETNINKEK